MKKIALAFAMLLTASAVIEAKTPPSLTVIAKSSSSYEVLYSGSEMAKVKISVADKGGNVLSSRVVENIAKFKMPLVLKNLSPGKYYVIVDNGNEVVKRELSYVEPAPIYSHVAKLSDDRYLISISNTRPSQPIEISVYDGQSNFVQSLSEVVEGQKAVIVKTHKVNGTPAFEVSDPSGLSDVIQN